MKQVLQNLFYLFFPLVVGGTIAFLIRDSIDYTSLVRPVLAPPKSLFSIAWTFLYLLMGISYYLYKKDFKENSFVDLVYYVQLFVNSLWSLIFFLLKASFIAVVWILLLDVLVFLLIYLFWNKKKISAYFNIPYLLWILFATYLTIGIAILN